MAPNVITVTEKRRQRQRWQRMRARAKRLSPAMRRGLELVDADRTDEVHGNILTALERRRMITADDRLTMAGRRALAR